MNKLKYFVAHYFKTAAVFCIFVISFHLTWAADLDAIVEGMQRRYASVSTIKANFQQTYRAPGMEHIESGVFWLKKPGLMRWEYQKPEVKLFIADGKETFLYIPQDKQVTVQPFSVSDMHSTPLKFLLGAGDILKSFAVAWESEFNPKFEKTVMIRLTPRKTESDYSFLALELNKDSYEIQSLAVREHSGDTSRFTFTNIATNVKVNNNSFRFKTPKGVEEVRFSE
jgi:outer membrane lipoprotein carrier protein